MLETCTLCWFCAYIVLLLAYIIFFFFLIDDLVFVGLPKHKEGEFEEEIEDSL